VAEGVGDGGVWVAGTGVSGGATVAVVNGVAVGAVGGAAQATSRKLLAANIWVHRNSLSIYTFSGDGLDHWSRSKPGVCMYLYVWISLKNTKLRKFCLVDLC